MRQLAESATTELRAAHRAPQNQILATLGFGMSSGDRMNEHAFGVSLGLRPRTPARCPASPSTVAGSTPVPTPDIRSTKNKAASDTWSDAAFSSGDRMNEHAFGVSLGLRPRTPARCPASPSTVAGSTPVPTPDIRSTKNKAASDTWSDAAFSSGDRIRTCDLRVMSPTSYQTALPRNKVSLSDRRG